MRQVISLQGEAAENAASLAARPGGRGQRAAAALQRRLRVNIDEEMANLLSLQNAYGANARVMSTVKDMLETLMRM